MSKFNFPIIDFTKGAKSLEAAGRTFTIRKTNEQADEPIGDRVAWVPHWSACPENLVFDDYHINICRSLDHKTAIIAKTLKFSQKGMHVWGRNTGLLAISFACPAISQPTKPNGVMVDAMALAIAESCAWHGIDPEKEIVLPRKRADGDTLKTVSGLVKFHPITDHAGYAKADGYSSYRVDIGTFLAPVRSKAIAFYKELKANKRQFELTSILKD